MNENDKAYRNLSKMERSVSSLAVSDVLLVTLQTI